MSKGPAGTSRQFWSASLHDNLKWKVNVPFPSLIAVVLLMWGRRGRRSTPLLWKKRFGPGLRISFSGRGLRRSVLRSLVFLELSAACWPSCALDIQFTSTAIRQESAFLVSLTFALFASGRLTACRTCLRAIIGGLHWASSTYGGSHSNQRDSSNFYCRSSC